MKNLKIMNINSKNIEAHLYDYAEDNLSKEEKLSVERFLENNPEYKSMLAEYDKKTMLPEPENIVFEDKEAFITTIEAKKRHSGIIYRIAAVALSTAAVVALLFTFSKTSMDSDSLPKSDSQIAREEPTIVEENKNTASSSNVEAKPSNKKINTRNAKSNTLPTSIQQNSKILVSNKSIMEQKQKSDETTLENNGLLADNTVSNRNDEKKGVKISDDTYYIIIRRQELKQENRIIKAIKEHTNVDEYAERIKDNKVVQMVSNFVEENKDRGNKIYRF